MTGRARVLVGHASGHFSAFSTADDSGEEAVAHSGFGYEVAGSPRLGFKFAAELGEVDAEVVGLLLVSGSPDFLEEVGLLHEVTGCAGEDFEESPFGWGEVDGFAVLMGNPAVEVEFERFGAQQRRPVVGCLGCVS